MKIEGTESYQEAVIPVNKFVAPGPDVTKLTDGILEILEIESFIKAEDC